jgi:hypothetical protein
MVLVPRPSREVVVTLFECIRDRVFPFALAMLLVELELDPWRHL